MGTDTGTPSISEPGKTLDTSEFDLTHPTDDEESTFRLTSGPISVYSSSEEEEDWDRHLSIEFDPSQFIPAQHTPPVSGLSHKIFHPAEYFHVLLIRGRNFPAIPGKIGSCDPYVVFKVRAGGMTVKTGLSTTKSKTLNPRWYQDFLFRLPRTKEKTLVIMVRDSNTVRRNKLLSKTELRFEDMRKWEETPIWIPLGDPDTGKVTKDRGQLQVKVKFDYKLSEKENLKSKLFKNNRKLFAMMTKKAATWAEIKDTLQTGDIVLFGSKTFPGKIIRFFTRSPYSHVAMIVRDDIKGEIKTWEALPEGGVQEQNIEVSLKNPAYVKSACVD